MKIFEMVKTQTKRDRSKTPTGTSGALASPPAVAGVRYIRDQNASQTSPAAPTNRKADCQPHFSTRNATMGGARIAPTAEPLLNNPAASARSRSGNHSATTLTPPGQFPASP